MARKICEECRLCFEPSRRTQRFCSARCADKQRDRRRRNQIQVAAGISQESWGGEATPELEATRQLAAALHATRQKLEATTKHCQDLLDSIQAKLRYQSSDVERLEAQNVEQHARIDLLQAEVARLKRAQRINVQDLAHIAAWLVSLAQAKGVALDAATLCILRRRGWTPSKSPSKSGAPRL